MLILRPLIVLMVAAISILGVSQFEILKETILSEALAATDETKIQFSEPAPNLSSEPRFASDLDRKKFAEIKVVLEQIATGRITLGMIEQYQIAIRFEAGGGSYFNPNTNEIVVEANHEPVRAALSIVHEVTHARHLHEGSTADILSDSRQTYIEKKVGEEVEGVVKSIEAKMELEAAGVEVGQLYTLEYLYRTTYNAAVEEATIAAPDSNQDSLETIGREAGKKAVYEGFMTGKTWTSVTKESYSDYYGATWDLLNPDS